MQAAQYTQLFCSSALFLFVWFCFRKILLPFLKNVEERQARTFGDEENAVQMHMKAKVLDAEIEEHLRRARNAGAEVRDEKVNKAKAESQKFVEQAEAWATAEVKRAELEILQIKGKAIGDVSGEAEKLAKTVLERVLSSGSSAVVH